MRHFDLIIVGTGSGNSILDERFADWDVAIVERKTFGGTCLNVGCIPTKMFVHTADIAATPAAAGRFGVDETLQGVRWADVRNRIFGRIDPIAAGGKEYREHHPDNRNVTVFTGDARFIGPKTLAVRPGEGGSAQEITAERIVLAAGGRPVIPDIAGLSEVAYHTSDTVMRIEALPRHATILGSGFIAAEFAHVFSSFGCDVTIVARSGGMLRGEDADISRRFTDIARSKWDLRLNRKTLRADAEGGGAQLHLDGPGGVETLSTDLLLVAVGRTPNADQLDVAATGISTLESGHVAVDEYQRTGVDGIWALGDISSPYELKHVANHEQRVVQHNLLHPDGPVAADHRFVPHAVFTSPQIASVGLTEQEVRRWGVRHVTSTQDYAAIAYGWAMEDTTGFAKLLADPDSGALLGAHIIGPQASTLIQPLIQAMHFGQSARDLARGQYWIHPSMPELIENALLNLPLG